jgi:flagellar assembly factor FliW
MICHQAIVTPPVPAAAPLQGVAAAGEGVAPVTANIMHFPAGLPGFEQCHGFVLMAPANNGPLQALQSTDGPPASFLVIDPRRVLPDFRCELSAADRHALGSSSDQALLWLALVSVEIDGTVTVNLRAPIVVNPARMIGRQLVPQSCIYPIRHVILGAE